MQKLTLTLQKMLFSVVFSSLFAICGGLCAKCRTDADIRQGATVCGSLYICAVMRLAFDMVYLCAVCAFRPLWRVFCALWRVLCAFAVLLFLSLCSQARYFRLCWLLACSLVFLCGCVVFVRSAEKFKPLTVAPSFPLSLGASSRAVLYSVIRSGCARSVRP